VLQPKASRNTLCSRKVEFVACCSMEAHKPWGITGDFRKRMLGFITGFECVLSALGERKRK